MIIPARDAAATVGRTLDALSCQDLDEEFEVIVALDGRMKARLQRSRRRMRGAARAGAAGPGERSGLGA